MEDLSRVVSLLTMSSNLEHAAMSLKKIVHKQDLDETETVALKWAGEFLRLVDWGSAVPEAQDVDGHAAVQATSIRPTFYACLFRIGPEFKEAGFTKESEVTSFLSKLYNNLEQPGAPGRGRPKLKDTEAGLGYQLLHGMAEALLVQVDNNGSPRPYTTDEWDSTPNEFAVASV